MIPFVTKSHLDLYKSVADSVRNSTIWPQYVTESQMLDVKSWIGDQLMNEIDEQLQTSPESLSVANSLLLDGGVYTYQSKKYIFMGLRAAIVYYAFKRFISRSSVNFTAAGITIKDTDFSTPASDKTIQRIATETLLTATSIKEETILFLRRNSANYPLYKCSKSNGQPRTFWVIGD